MGFKILSTKVKRFLKELSAAIAQDSNGNLIIGTIEGLSVFDGKIFTNYTKENGLPNERVNSVAVLDNKVAIATDSGLFYLVNKKITGETNLKKETVEKIKSIKNNFVGITRKKVFTKNEKS